jgi:ABC-type glycerol-3-phosphate transport system substrate-binding protein
MVDAEFTPLTGIPVRININPNEEKLILASSAGKQPDIAMGIAGWRPYDFAIRNNVYDLSTFDDFREVSDRFYPGSFMQLIYQDGVYGLPETQNFYLLFYRQDILQRLQLDIPSTWDDVISILPELQRFGMNFYSMLSSTNAFKAFVLTMPFIRQFGGKIFSDDGLAAAYDDPNTIEALTLMTDLFTTYSLPLEVGSFYNEFRYGRLPIGIGDFGMYISLLHAAPEIAGLWNIAPLPGIEQDGIVNRSFDGSSTSAMMFKNTDKPNESWSFLKWWTSASTQLDYAENLISAYGPEYLWNSSNREAFGQMSWDETHRQTILDQWQWIDDTAKTPASYMVERELSNIWNKVVFQGVNLRTAIEDSLIIANKEIRRKMLEFRFIDQQGNTLKPYLLPTKETLTEWVGTT